MTRSKLGLLDCIFCVADLAERVLIIVTDVVVQAFTHFCAVVHLVFEELKNVGFYFGYGLGLRSAIADASLGAAVNERGGLKYANYSRELDLDKLSVFSKERVA